LFFFAMITIEVFEKSRVCKNYGVPTITLQSPTAF
jgi:hypothetical protein